eukprot:TRINITY_DN24440_c0_g1_i1.p1 TRINITY_DN24440_c0_g1~~TRINITY_DN24440_c0_g1_i1.p1  ORF type:complete len:322 (+),score=48.99 TRINITY_DN24440_c0_g1_i1:55-1020(+)
MAIYDGSKYNGLSGGFRQLLESRKPLETITLTDGQTTKRIWEKGDRPSYRAEVIPDKKHIDPAALDAARKHELLPPLRVRILGQTQDLTIDEDTEFEKQVVLEGLCGKDTIFVLKQRIFEQENIPILDQRIFLPPHELQDEFKLGQCFVQWSGFGLDDWPPKFILKSSLQGFEVTVDVPASRSTAVWDHGKGKLKRYGKRRLTFDLLPNTTLRQLKELLERRLSIPTSRQLLSAQMANEGYGFNYNGYKACGYSIDLDDDSKTVQDYGLDRSCIVINFQINRFDENGDFIFEDDSYFDHEGFHPPVNKSWMPPTSTAWRPA